MNICLLQYTYILYMYYTEFDISVLRLFISRKSPFLRTPTIVSWGQFFIQENVRFDFSNLPISIPIDSNMSNWMPRFGEGVPI